MHLSQTHLSLSFSSLPMDESLFSRSLSLSLSLSLSRSLSLSLSWLLAELLLSASAVLGHCGGVGKDGGVRRSLFQVSWWGLPNVGSPPGPSFVPNILLDPGGEGETGVGHTVSKLGTKPSWGHIRWERLNNKSCFCLCLWRFSHWSCLKELEVNGSPHQRKKTLLICFGAKRFSPPPFLWTGWTGETHLPSRVEGCEKPRETLAFHSMSIPITSIFTTGWPIWHTKNRRDGEKRERHRERDTGGEEKALHGGAEGACPIINWWTATKQRTWECLLAAAQPD